VLEITTKSIIVPYIFLYNAVDICLSLISCAESLNRELYETQIDCNARDFQSTQQSKIKND